MLGHLGDAGKGRAEGKERHPGEVVLPAHVEQRFMRAIEEAVGVLHADDAGRQSVAELVEGDVAHADAADLPLVA